MKQFIVLVISFVFLFNPHETTALILTGVLLIITRTLSQQIEEKIIADFNNTQAYFQKQQSLIFDRLVESCYLSDENSTF